MTPEPVRRKLDLVVRLDVAGTATVGGASLWRVDKQNDELATTAGQRSKSNLAGLQLDVQLPGGCLVGSGSGDEAQALVGIGSSGSRSSHSGGKAEQDGGHPVHH